jgi:dolichol-phosphate mannosyltransferase
MRWLKFNVVGAMGATVHLGLLTLLVHVLGMHYLLATALSVEAAILHNFMWHRRWTWSDRRAAPAAASLLIFNLTSGLVSIASNLLSAYLLTGGWGIDPVVANLVAIALGSIVNLFLSDRVAFAGTTRRRLGRCTTGQAPARDGP